MFQHNWSPYYVFLVDWSNVYASILKFKYCRVSEFLNNITGPNVFVALHGISLNRLSTYDSLYKYMD